MAQSSPRATPATKKRKRNTPTTDASEEPFPYHVCDPEGDLLLRATEAGSQQTRIFRVNRACLCLASPVFRAMLGKDSSFKEGLAANTTEKTPVVDVEEENMRVFIFLLAIFHFINDHVKKKVSFRTLYDIALLCDKYDCSESLRPWTAIWVRQFVELNLAEVEGVERCLFIAWALQSEELFTNATTFLIRNCQLTRGGKLFINDSNLTVDEGPSAVIDEITKLRSLHIRAIQKTVLQKIASVKRPNHQPCEVCGNDEKGLPYASCVTAQIRFLLDAFPNVKKQSDKHLFLSKSLQSIENQAQVVGRSPTNRPGCFEASKLPYLLDYVKDRIEEVEALEMPE